MKNKCIGNRCWIYCKCCCGCGCRYQWCLSCCSDDITPKEIYTLAKYEIELMVDSQKDKSLTLSNVSHQSQKDVMSSHVEAHIHASASFKE